MAQSGPYSTKTCLIKFLYVAIFTLYCIYLHIYENNNYNKNIIRLLKTKRDDT